MELKPCPFCGDSRVYLRKDIQDGEEVTKTSHTGCEAEVMFYGDNIEARKAVVEAWNKRQNLEVDLLTLDFEGNSITVEVSKDVMDKGFHCGTIGIDLSGVQD